ncbi:phosphoglycolate phosphatase [Rhizobium sp. Root149]|nr:phosphoglycolate phosphatase [Rhizobium sp. Root149]
MDLATPPFSASEGLILTATLVVFDLDGTMIDTAPDLIESLNHTIAARDLEPVSFDDLTHLVGQGARVMIRRAFDLRGYPLSDQEVDPLFDRFIDHYKAHMPGQSRPFAGLEASLDRLERDGCRVAVCTNKAEQLAVPLLRKLGLADRMAVITGGDTFAFRKPDGRHLLETIRLAGGDPAKSLLVGDSVNDIQAAHNASVASLGVTFGYSDVPIADLNPTRIISHFDELTVELVQETLAASHRAPFPVTA